MNKREQGRWAVWALTILAVAAIAVAAVGYLQPDNEPDQGRRYMRNASGAVLFTHSDHQAQVGDCVSCHHELVSGGAVACTDCHEDPEYTPALADHDELLEYHEAACAECHDVAEARNAQSCRACHPAAAEEGDAVLGCDGCHDDPDYTSELAGHDELLEIEDHECAGCHTPRAVSDIYHATCNACHLNSAPDRFADGEGQVICGGCHLK